jgi:hypothetical protein
MPTRTQTRVLSERAAKLVCMTLAAMAAELLIWSALTARAQEPEQKGIEIGNYNVAQSVEFGYRFTDLSGNLQTYDSFINLQQGPRLLDYSLQMRSLNHHGAFFDRLSFSNFGYGGDPNDVSRLSIDKNKLYNFSANFRRDENVFDYSLLANPLNPVSTFANAPAGFNPILGSSPHKFDTRRKMSDYGLTLFPQSRLRFRLGYTWNANNGPAFTTFHQGTEALLLENVSTTENTYRFGVDFKFLPQTNISYDQIFAYFKGDTGIQDQNQLFVLANGAPVDIGVSLNAAANQPCANAFLAGGVVNPACNALFAYNQHGRARTSSPTEQLSLQSNYFHNIDLSARVSYTGGTMSVTDWNALFSGLESRTNLRNENSSGPVSGRHVAASADAGVTWHVTQKFDVLDSFHFSNFHNPAQWNYTLCQFFSPSLLVAPTAFPSTASLPAQCASPVGAVAGTPPHRASSGPDISAGLSSLFLKQDEKTNLFELEYQFTPRFGARLGDRYRSRTIVTTDLESGTFVLFPSLQNARPLPLPFSSVCPATNNLAGGTCILTPVPLFSAGNVPIHEYSGVLGLWAQPVESWRISFDTEIMSADNAFTRISPRQRQEYRLRSTYKPTNWMNLTGSVDVLESRNNVVQIDNLQHNRAYGFSAMLEPNDRIALELGYDFNGVFSQILICYTSSTAPAGLAKCPGSTVLVEQLSIYTDRSHFGYFDLMFRPLRRLTMKVGTNITSTSGSALLLTPTAPPGTLNSNFYRPYGGFDFLIAKGLTWRTYWNYYGYSEGLSATPQDIFAPRNFRGNTVTLSGRYAF